MTFSDKSLACQSCEESFLFSADEQKYFADKGLCNEPKRCPNCRILFRLKRDGKDPSTATKVDCAECGVMTMVPFKPSGRRPVYCGSCLRQNQLQESYVQKSTLVSVG